MPPFVTAGCFKASRLLPVAASKASTTVSSSRVSTTTTSSARIATWEPYSVGA